MQDYYTLIAGAVRDVTGDDIVAIADIIVARKARGLSHSVWHCTSILFSSPCHCADCDPPKRARSNAPAWAL